MDILCHQQSSSGSIHLRLPPQYFLQLNHIKSSDVWNERNLLLLVQGTSGGDQWGHYLMLSRCSASLGPDLVHGSTWTGVGIRIRSIEANPNNYLFHCCDCPIFAGRILASFIGSRMAVADRLHLLRCSSTDLYALPLL